MTSHLQSTGLLSRMTYWWCVWSQRLPGWTCPRGPCRPGWASNSPHCPERTWEEQQEALEFSWKPRPTGLCSVGRLWRSTGSGGFVFTWASPAASWRSSSPPATAGSSGWWTPPGACSVGLPPRWARPGACWVSLPRRAPPWHHSPGPRPSQTPLSVGKESGPLSRQ